MYLQTYKHMHAVRRNSDTQILSNVHVKNCYKIIVILLYNSCYSFILYRRIFVLIPVAKTINYFQFYNNNNYIRTLEF